MKVYGGVKVELISFLTSAGNGKWSCSCLSHSTHQEKPAVSTGKGARWAPEPVRTLESRENPLPLSSIGSRLVVKPVATKQQNFNSWPSAY